jgi:hypothetical protein
MVEQEDQVKPKADGRYIELFYCGFLTHLFNIGSAYIFHSLRDNIPGYCKNSSCQQFIQISVLTLLDYHPLPRLPQRHTLHITNYWYTLTASTIYLTGGLCNWFQRVITRFTLTILVDL